MEQKRIAEEHHAFELARVRAMCEVNGAEMMPFDADRSSMTRAEAKGHLKRKGHKLTGYYITTKAEGYAENEARSEALIGFYSVAH